MSPRFSGRSIDLKARLLGVIGLIAIMQMVVAVAAIRITEGQLLGQIDDRIAVIGAPERLATFDEADGTLSPPPQATPPLFAGARPPPGPGRPPPQGPTLDGDRPSPAFAPPPLPDGAVPLGGAGFAPPPGSPGPPDRFGDTYEARLHADNSLTTFFVVDDIDAIITPPRIDVDTATEADGRPLTVDSMDAGIRYRLVASPLDGGDFFVVAVALDEVDATISRLQTVAIATVALVSIFLAFLAWWVLRLGIAPIKRMTGTAEAIAAGDLSERIANPDHNTEAGQLGHAINTMLGQIETSMEERQHAEAKLRQFMADASHELRTPVATIRGYAELYRCGGLRDPNELRDALRRTEQESERMTRLISDMLDLAKLDRSPSLATVPVDVVAIARDAASDAQARYPDRVITSVAATEQVTVEGDEDLLRQALANLVSNAIVHTDAAASVTISAYTQDNHGLIRVSDTGKGMKPRDLSRVTERFYRADPSRSRHKGGSGLGLSIVESVAKAHEGALTLDSTPGTGTTVTISVPLLPSGFARLAAGLGIDGHRTSNMS